MQRELVFYVLLKQKSSTRLRLIPSDGRFISWISFTFAFAITLRHDVSHGGALISTRKLETLEGNARKEG